MGASETGCIYTELYKNNVFFYNKISMRWLNKTEIITFYLNARLL